MSGRVEHHIVVIRRGRAGRKPRGSVASSRRIELRITPQEHAELGRVAAENKMPIASVIREAVNEFVGDYSERAVFSEKRRIS